MNKKAILTLGIVTLLAFVTTAGAAESNEPKIGMAAPNLAGLEWIKGGPVQMQKGTTYVVEFWATWCPPCRKSIPHLTAVQAEFKDKGVTIIGISDETSDKVKPFVAEKGDEMAYTVAISPGRKAHQAYMDAFKVRGIPHAFIVDKNGTLVWHGHPMADMDVVLKQVVAGNFDHVTYAEKQAAEEEAMAKLQTLYSSYFTITTGQDGDLEKAKEIGAELLKSDHTGMLNSLAWTILIKVPAEKQDLELAKNAGAKAVKLSEGKDAAILDTYARAAYELGKKYIAEAVASQKKAVELSDGNEDLKKSLERYEAATVE